MRPLALKIHRYCGLLMVLFLLNAGLSGTALVFRDDIDGWLNADAVRIAVTGPVLSVAAMEAALGRQLPQARVTRFLTGETPSEAWLFQLAPRGTMPLAVDEIWLNPYTGEVSGQRLAGAARLDRRHLMPMLLRWHDSLYLGKTGQSVIGAIALLWLLSSLLGIYLATPRAGSLLKAFTLKTNAGSFKTVFDLHRVAGLLTCMVLLGSAFSATCLGLPEQFKFVVRLFSPATAAAPAAPPAKRGDATPVSVDQAMQAALDALPGSQLRGVNLQPGNGTYQVRVRLPGDINLGKGTGRVLVDMQTGAVLDRRSFRQAGTAGDTLIAWMYPLHSGQAFGTAGRFTIAGIGLFPGVLALTGAFIWWRRRRMLAARRGASRAN